MTFSRLSKRQNWSSTPETPPKTYTGTRTGLSNWAQATTSLRDRIMRMNTSLFPQRSSPIKRLLRRWRAKIATGELRPSVGFLDFGPRQTRAKKIAATSSRGCLARLQSRECLRDVKACVDGHRTTCGDEAGNYLPWHRLYFLPLPHGQGSLRPTLSTSRFVEPLGRAAIGPSP